MSTSNRNEYPWPCGQINTDGWVGREILRGTMVQFPLCTEVTQGLVRGGTSQAPFDRISPNASCRVTEDHSLAIVKAWITHA